MASTSTPITSSSSSSSENPPWKYEVFLSFHGEDTRHGFTEHVRRDLERNGIIVFRDDTEMERGEQIAEELFKAIAESRYAVVVISNNYSFSTWCLKELTRIMERMKEGRIKVLPIFYRVDPSDVRKLRKSFKEAFDQHIKNGVDEELLKSSAATLEQLGNCIVDPSDVEKQDASLAEASTKSSPEEEEEPYETWRAALTEAGQLAGWHVYNRSEEIVVQEISATIFGCLMRCLPDVPKFLVGMDSPVKEMWRLLDIGSDDVRFVGICGMGGIGKTTLARVIYERVSSQFTASCFIARIGEASGRELVRLQKDLISAILTKTAAKTLNDSDDTNAGISLLGNRLRTKKVFIVLDDVCQNKQIEALAGSSEWFDTGSKIIITSRYRNLTHLVEDNIYDITELNFDDAKKLFCHKAFNKGHPQNEFQRLIKDSVDCAGHIPLALEVFGSYLRNAKKSIWESYLNQVKTNLDKNVSGKLRITFDGLEKMAQEAYLDIACFFNGWFEEDVTHKLNCLGYPSKSILNTLESKSLIKFSNDGKLIMHDLLAKLGEEIAGHSRLWHAEDIISVLRNEIGDSEVQAIVLQLPLPEREELYYEAFSAMENLRLLCIIGNNERDIETVKWDGEPSKLKLSHKLRVMEWWGYPLKSLPAGSKFEPTHLVELKLKHSCIERLWDKQKRLLELKHIDLSFSKKLIETSDLSRIQKLQILDLSYCESLSKIDSSIARLELLKKLSLQGCCNLKQFPDSVREISNLYELSLDDHILQALPKLPSCVHLLRLRIVPLVEAFDSPMTKEISEEMLEVSVPFTVTYVGLNHKPYKILYPGPRSPSMIAYVDGHYHPIKFAVTCGPMQGSEISEWFNEANTSLDEEIQIRMDWNFQDGMSRPRACALLIVYEVQGHKCEAADGACESNNHILPELMCKFQVNDASPKQTLEFCVPIVARNGSHGVWVFINTPDSLGGSVFTKRWSCQVSITTSNKNVVLKECGARLLALDAHLAFSKFLRSNSQQYMDSQNFYRFLNRFMIITSTCSINCCGTLF